jgi:hypothetical protein
VIRRALLGGRRGQRRMMGGVEKHPKKKLSQVLGYRYVPERDGVPSLRGFLEFLGVSGGGFCSRLRLPNTLFIFHLVLRPG